MVASTVPLVKQTPAPPSLYSAVGLRSSSLVQLQSLSKAGSKAGALSGLTAAKGQTPPVADSTRDNGRDHQLSVK